VGFYFLANDSTEESARMSPIFSCKPTFFIDLRRYPNFPQAGPALHCQIGPLRQE
jgi:hypothetical protein